MRNFLPFEAALLVFLCCASVQQASAVSLWRDDTGRLFADRKALRVGDIVTVLVVEDAKASNQSQMKLTKDAKSDVSGQGSGFLDFIPLFGAKLGLKKEHQGKGQTTLSGKMTARVAAQVVEVRPNGNLVIEGSRTVKINDDEDRIAVRGVVRPEDIASDNTVLSTYLSEAQISYTGSGPGKHAAREGIIARILNFLF